MMFRQLGSQIARLRDAGHCWRTAIDALRPVSNQLWRGLSVADRNRFLRYLKTYWEVHRHRMAPQIRRRMEELLAEGRVRVIPGRIRQIEVKGRSVELTVAQRGVGEWRLEVDRAINCTGIHEDYRQRPRRFIRALIQSGLAAPNDLGIGFRTDEFGELIDAQDRRSEIWLTLGPRAAEIRDYRRARNSPAGGSARPTLGWDGLSPRVIGMGHSVNAAATRTAQETNYVVKQRNRYHPFPPLSEPDRPAAGGNTGRQGSEAVRSYRS